MKIIQALKRSKNSTNQGGRSIYFEWGGARDELQVHMVGGKNRVRGRAPEKFCNPFPIIQ